MGKAKSYPHQVQTRLSNRHMAFLSTLGGNNASESIRLAVDRLISNSLLYKALPPQYVAWLRENEPAEYQQLVAEQVIHVPGMAQPAQVSTPSNLAQPHDPDAFKSWDDDEPDNLPPQQPIPGQTTNPAPASVPPSNTDADRAARNAQLEADIELLKQTERELIAQSTFLNPKPHH